METININEKVYKIYLETGKTDIEFVDDLTGMTKIFKLLSIYIEPRNKCIITKWRSFDKTPTGLEINATESSYSSNETDFNAFESNALGVSIKKSAVNGFFRYIDKSTIMVYDEHGVLISEQPVN